MPVHFWFFRVWVVYTFSLPVSLPVSLYFLHHVDLIQVTIALRFHLFPFRTEKLSSVTPMVLRNSGRVGSRRFFREKPLYRKMQGLSCFWAIIPNRNAMHPFICPFHLSIFRFYSLFLFSLLSYCYLYGTKLVKNDIFYENGLLLFHSSCLISNGFS